jgi:nicotinic acid phosphoribosyltransferase
MFSNMINNINPAVMSDSYKAVHYMLYPDAKQMSAYGSFRKPFDGMDDNRVVFFGIRNALDYVSRKWTDNDVKIAEKFYDTYNVGYTKHPFPKELFLKFIDEFDGYFPVTIQALPEGTVAYIGTPVYQITAQGIYTPLVTFLETILTHVWYACNVATLSRMTKDIISRSFDQTVDPEYNFLLDSRLHDFGFRGCTSIDQSIIGGAAHLLNFTGSDTMSASFYVQYHLNDGRPRATSIPATEHSNMTAWRTERDAFDHATKQFGHGIFATVMDSNDYDKACDEIAPEFAQIVKDKGGLWVWRPDSGDPVKAVLKGLHSAEKAFGSVTNKKGFKVLNNSAVIQGDGINQHTIKEILDAVTKAGFSAQNVAFGMGGALLQKHNRDSMSFATKLSHIIYDDSTEKNVMKAPKTDSSKVSLPGRIDVCYDTNGCLKTYPAEVVNELGLKSAFRVVYDKGPIDGVWDSFDTLVKRVEQEWNRTPNGGNPYSDQMITKINATLSELHKN